MPMRPPPTHPRAWLLAARLPALLVGLATAPVGFLLLVVTRREALASSKLLLCWRGKEQVNGEAQGDVLARAAPFDSSVQGQLSVSRLAAKHSSKAPGEGKVYYN